MFHPSMLLLTLFSLYLLCTVSAVTGSKSGFRDGPHVIKSNRTPTSPICRQLEKLFGIKNPSDTAPVNKLLASFDPCKQLQEPTASSYQRALDPLNPPSPEHKQQALQDEYRILALQNANPNDKLMEIKQLLPPALSSGNPGGENVLHENLQLERKEDHYGIYEGEFHPTTKDRCGLGVFFGTAFPSMYVGNWKEGFKHGYGLNLYACDGGIVAEAYEWERGVPLRQWIAPSSLKNAITGLDKCTFRGANSLLKLLKRCPRSKVLDHAAVDRKEPLEHNTVYLIEVEDDGRRLEILEGKMHDSTSLIPSSVRGNKPYGKFVAMSLGNNRYTFLPAHNRCHKLAVNGDVAGEGITIVQKEKSPEEMHVWIVERNDTDTLSIKHEKSGLYWEASNPGTFKVHLAKKKFTPLQHFIFIKQDLLASEMKDPVVQLKEGGKYMIKNVNYSTYLARKNAGTVDHTLIVCENSSSSLNHNHMIWEASQAALNPKPTEPVWQFLAVATESPKKIDIPGKATGAGVQPIIWKATPDANQQFKMIRVEGKSNVFLLQAMHAPSPMCLQTFCNGFVAQHPCDPNNVEQQYQFFVEPQMALLVDGTMYSIQARNGTGALFAREQDGRVTLSKDSEPAPIEQLFVAKHNGNDTYTFQTKQNSGKTLGYDKTSGVSIFSNTNDNKTKWHVERSGGNFFRLANVAANQYLTANVHDNKVSLDKWKEETAQDFILKPMS